MTVCPPLPALIQVAVVCLAAGVAVGLFLARLMARTGRYSGRIPPDMAGGWHRRSMPETIVWLQICPNCQEAYEPVAGHECQPPLAKTGVAE